MDENYTLNETNLTNMCPEITLPPALVVTQEILYALVCIVGLLGNTLVIYVVLRYSKMQTVTNMYIVNLAIADECFLIGIPFLIVTMHLSGWVFGNAMCKAYLISASINQFTSSIFLLIMSADRYIAVCHPISSPKWRTPFISRIVSILAWTCSALFVIPVFMYATTVPRHGSISCNIIWTDGEDQSGQTTFTLYTLVVGFATPLVLILVFYCLVIRKLKTVGPKNKSKEKKRSHRKVTKLVLTVITVYVFCWLPYWVAQVALIFSSPKSCQSKIGLTIYLLSGCLSYSNSAMNPILYAFLSDNFKKSFLKACTCAAGKDVNATLHMENSVFPRRKTGSDRSRPCRGTTTICHDPEDEEVEGGLLVSKADPSTSAITMTSRSNITVTAESKENREGVVKNGIVTIQPTQL